MGVVPAGAVLGCAELVRESAAVGRDGALGDAVGAIMELRALLVQAVPVDGGSVGVLASRIPVCSLRGWPTRWIGGC